MMNPKINIHLNLNCSNADEKIYGNPDDFYHGETSLTVNFFKIYNDLSILFLNC